jgi:hypothetical protein
MGGFLGKRRVIRSAGGETQLIERQRRILLSSTCSSFGEGTSGAQRMSLGSSFPISNRFFCIVAAGT